MTCNYFLNRSAMYCAFQCISSCYILLVFRVHNRKQTYFLEVTEVCEKHEDVVGAHAPTSCGGQIVFQCSAKVLISEHDLIITSGLGLGLFFEKLPLTRGMR